MVRSVLSPAGCVLVLAATAGCGGTGGDGVADRPAATPSAATVPVDAAHPHRLHCNKIDLAAINADRSDRVPATTLDPVTRARIVLTPTDPRSFIAKVTRAQLIGAGIAGAGQMPAELILVVNHGSWARSELGVKVPPGAPAVAERPIVWRAAIYDPARQRVIKRFGGPDTACFKGF